MTSEQFEIDADTPLGQLVTQAGKAFARADVSTMDRCYRQALQLAARSALRAALAADHVGRLLALHRPSLALTRCAEYLAAADTASTVLRLRRAEVFSQVGAHGDAERMAAEVRAEFAAHPGLLTDDEQARLLRVEGLAAADRSDFDQAGQCLDTARQLFLAAGDRVGAEAIERDQRLLATRRGAPPAEPDDEPTTTEGRLALAAGLRAQGRYEEAYTVLVAVDIAGLDPALRFPVLAELCRLLRLMRDDDTADTLADRLATAVAESPDSTAEWTLHALRPLAATDDLPGNPPDRTDLAIQHARWMILANRLAEAERRLAILHPRMATARELAAGQLALGELRLAWYSRLAKKTDLMAAIHHLTAAVRHAEVDNELVETRILALRTLGRAYYAYARPVDQRRDPLNPDQRASECWSAAHRLEERVAELQCTDQARVRMLLAATGEHDERVRAAAAAIERWGGAAAAGMVVAMEAARGATSLGSLVPAPAGARILPRPTDSNAAWRWVAEFGRELRRDQAVWLLYQTPDHLHQVLLGNRLLRHVSIRLHRTELVQIIEKDLVSWTSRELLEAGVRNGEFDRLVAEFARRVAVARVLKLLPDRITRIAIVADGELADIPFAALPIPGSPSWLGLRYALSELPNLSALRPLRDRSARQRGDRSLLVSPPDDRLTKAAPLTKRLRLEGQDATVDQLRAALKIGRHQWLRIDSHGQHDHEHPDESWLRLGTGSTGGRLHAEKLRDMDLSRCGTVVLGACESGMAQRRGRDERMGFVRAAIQAGTAAVVAARWVAEDVAAAGVLDRFDRYLRYLPRDVALQRAQLELCAAEPAVAHPARWACWTLYGDPGWQTSAGPLRRVARRHIEHFHDSHRRSGVR